MLHTSFKSAGCSVKIAVAGLQLAHIRKLASSYYPDVGSVKRDAKRVPPDEEGAKGSAVAGTEAATCAIGWATADSRGRNPIATPTGIVHIAASSKANSTLRNVAPAPDKMCRSSTADRVEIMESIFATA